VTAIRRRKPVKGIAVAAAFRESRSYTTKSDGSSMNHDELQEAARGHLLFHFSRHADLAVDELLVLDRGEGPYVFDTAGRRYLDALSCLFCAQLGYSYGREMGQAAARQLERLGFNTNWGTAHPAAIELADRLAALAPETIDHAFFTSGGSESVEAAWKLVRLYHLANGEPQRTKAISRAVAYHGASLGALAFTSIASAKEPFGPPAVPVCTVSNTNAYRSETQGPGYTRSLLDEIESRVLAEGPDTVAMLIAEPVQNAGGCLVPPAGYWAGLRELCDRYGILLVADEVITGFGRVGEWFAVSRMGAVPDMITIAKGLTSAYAPMGAVLVSDRVAESFYEPGRTLQHGITFGGHPLAAAIALQNIEIFEREGILDNVRGNEEGLARRLNDLRALPIVGDVRGAGFFWALELVSDDAGGRFAGPERDALLQNVLPRALRDAGLIARCDGRGDTVLQVAPPLISDEAILDEMTAKLAQVLATAQDTVLDAARAAA
jgi:adenosylmethionine-8-amino-7-oxononanoate aminotransferase